METKNKNRKKKIKNHPPPPPQKKTAPKNSKKNLRVIPNHMVKQKTFSRKLGLVECFLNMIENSFEKEILFQSLVKDESKLYTFKILGIRNWISISTLLIICTLKTLTNFSKLTLVKEGGVSLINSKTIPSLLLKKLTRDAHLNGEKSVILKIKRF